MQTKWPQTDKPKYNYLRYMPIHLMLISVLIDIHTHTRLRGVRLCAELSVMLDVVAVVLSNLASGSPLSTRFTGRTKGF